MYLGGDLGKRMSDSGESEPGRGGGAEKPIVGILASELLLGAHSGSELNTGQHCPMEDCRSWIIVTSTCPWEHQIPDIFELAHQL